MPASPGAGSTPVGELFGAISAPARDRLRVAAAVGEETGCRVAWVGGGVRDLLLESRACSVDLDLVIEGELDRFVGRLAGALGATRIVRSAFLTAVLELPGGERLDVAQARRERYSGPAALPSVEPADLESDLVRRDFTVNSLAIRLDALFDLDAFGGALVDPAGGFADLEARRLRVHHERSFVDDPTRIFRGIDFEARLGLRFEPATERLARSAEAASSLDRLSGARLLAVLRKAFGRRRSAGRALDRAAELGILRTIHPRLHWPAGRESFDAMAAGLSGADENAATGSESVLLLALCRLCLDSPAATRSEIARRLDLDARARALLISGMDRLGAVRLAEDSRPSFVHRSLAPMGEIELALLGARGPVEASWVERERSEMRPTRLAIGGRQLLERGLASGPAIRWALDQTLDARIDGSIEPEGELDFALAEAAKWGKS